MCKKILFVASVSSHFHAFHIPYFEWLKNQGFEVHATAFQDKEKPLDFCDKFINIDFKRSPFALGNIKAYKELKSLIKQEKYDVIHCHTPMASVITRLAAKKFRKRGLKVIYTAHGFHFYKGAPLFNWLFFFPVEKFLSRYTDALITINQEDYNALTKYNFKAKNNYLVHGVGVKTSRLFQTNDNIRKELRKEYGYSDSQFILIYVAEFIKRKNHKFLLDSVSRLKDKILNLKVLLAGNGVELDNMKTYAQDLGISQYVDFLGFRSDIGKIIALSDVGISTSKQEGLGLNVAEYMYSGIPTIVSEDRGHKELVQDGKNGYMYKQGDINEFVNKTFSLFADLDLRNQFSLRGKQSVNKFLLSQSIQEHSKIYADLINL